MTVADLIADMESLRTTMRDSAERFHRFCVAETRASHAMARANVPVVRIGDTVYVRYNNSLTVHRDVPEASAISVPQS